MPGRQKGTWSRVKNIPKSWGYWREMQNERFRQLGLAVEAKGIDPIQASQAKGFADALSAVLSDLIKAETKHWQVQLTDLVIDENAYQQGWARAARWCEDLNERYRFDTTADRAE